MKNYYALFICLCSVTWAVAQQVPQYSLYPLNLYAHNPAYAGLENTLVGVGLYRQQWTGLEGAPTTQQVNAHLPIYAISSGLGLRIQNDRIGAHSTTDVVMSYSYQINLNRDLLLSLGLSAGWLQYALDGSKLRAPEGTYVDPDFNHNEAVLPIGKVRAGAPVLEAGLFLQSRKWDLGLSSQPVFATRLAEKSNGGFAIQPVQHLFLYSAFHQQLGENLVLSPSILVKSDLAKTQLEISAMARWRENTFAGASFRGLGKDAAVIFAGLKLNEKTTLAYAYDIPLSALKTVNRGSHELLLKYSLNKPIGVGKLPPVIYNPRFF